MTPDSLTSLLVSPLLQGSVSVFAVATGLWVCWHERGRHVSRLFLGFALILGTICGVRASIGLVESADTALLLYRIWYALVAIGSALYFHFCFHALNISARHWLPIHLSWVLYSLLAMAGLESAAIVTSLRDSPFGALPVPGPLLPVLVSLQLLQLLVVGLMWRARVRDAPRGSDERHRLMAFGAMILLLVLATSDMLMHLTDLGLPLTGLMIVPLMATSAWMTARYSLIGESSAIIRGAISRQLPNPLISTDADGVIHDLNPAAETLLSAPATSVRGRRLADFLDRELDGDTLASLADTRRELGIGVKAESTPETLSASMTAIAAIDARHRLVGYLCSLTLPDEKLVTERSTLLDRLRSQPLLEQRLQEALNLVGETLRRSSVIVVGIDRFRAINESIGETGADELLAQLACRLADRVGNSGIVARTGSDEFTVLLQGFDDSDNGSGLADEIAQWSGTNWLVDGVPIYVSLTGVVVALDRNGIELPAFQTELGSAMAEAKRSARGEIRRHEIGAGGNSSAFDEATTAALEAGQFSMYYQPVIASTTGRIQGFEALTRWPQGDGSHVPPGRFLSRLQALGRMPELDHWVLNRVARDTATLLEQARDASLYVNVNLSAEFLGSDGIERVVVDATTQAGIARDALQIEVLESAALSARVANNVEALSRAGLRLCIDDFGTGYSSLNRLHTLPFQVLKLDRSFVIAMVTDRSARELVEGIIDLAHELSLGVIAEGVEKAETARQLRDMGVGAQQGFLYSPAVALEQAREWLRQDVRFTLPRQQAGAPSRRLLGFGRGAAMPPATGLPQG